MLKITDFLKILFKFFLLFFLGIGKSHNDAASVRTSYPIPAACGLYYFEVKIISKGRDGYMGIGLTTQSFKANRLPGILFFLFYLYHFVSSCDPHL